MKKMMAAVLFLIALLINNSINAEATAGNIVTVATDKPEYLPGQQITISGTVSQGDRSISNTDVTLKLEQAGQVLQVDQTLTTPSGYVFSINLAENAQLGDYTVVVQALGVSNQVTFKVSREPAPGPAPGPGVPGTPSGFQFISSTSIINLSWSSVTGATGYQIKRNGVIIYRGSATSFTDHSLTPSTAYQYELKAFNASGTGTAANLTAVTQATIVQPSPEPPPVTAPPQSPTLPQLPGAIGEFKGKAETKSIILSWGASERAATYTVKRDGQTIYQGAHLTFTDSGLNANKSYQYEITAENAGGKNTPVSLTISTLKEAPKALSGFNYTNDATSISLSWNMSDGAESYELKRNGTVIYSGNGLSFKDTQLKPGTSYTYELKAVNTAGASSTVVLGADTLKSKPDLIANLKALALETQVNLTWTKNSNADLYVVKLNNKIIYHGSQTSFLFKNAKANESYTFSVTALNNAGQSPSSVVAVKTKPSPVTLSAAASKSLYKKTEPVTITFTLKDKNKKALANTNVTIVIADPKGKTKTYNAKTNKSGVVVLKVNGSKASFAGTYKVKATTKFTSKDSYSNQSVNLSYRLK